MRISVRKTASMGTLLLFGAGHAIAQGTGVDRTGTMEFGFNVLQFDARKLDFTGGSTVSLDDNLGLGLDIGYHLSNHLELKFELDWADRDYDGILMSSSEPGTSVNVRGSMQSVTPKLSAAWYFGNRVLTPYVTGGIGWVFLDTNIPDGPPLLGCWYDPWWGTICAPYQDTKRLNEFVYGLGAGVRWSVSPAISIRLGYERRWIDLDNGAGTPGSNILSAGIRMRYSY